MPKGGKTPILVVGAFGTGNTREQLSLMFRIFYRLFLREQMADKEKQDAVLKASEANYTLIQPVALTDKPGTGT
nr:NAD(P)H-binding protein [Loktanella fryxellensis]